MRLRHMTKMSTERAADERGIALVVTMMVMMLASVLMVTFVAAIIADQRASGLDRDQTQAYAVAHAGLEKLTSDLNALFVSDVSPSTSQIAAVTGAMPTIPGFQFIAPDGTSGYRVDPKYVDANGNPRPESTTGSPITVGPYQGFVGIITPYNITVTARSTGGAEVRMRRELQTVAVPVFQFGMFSETDLAFHAGDNFDFGGRVHTNGNLFLAQSGTSSDRLWLRDRVTALGEVIRTHLPNGYATSSSYYRTVNLIRAPGQYRALQMDEGSRVGTLGSALNEPKWSTISTGTYNSYIRNGSTGVTRLDLPLVADADGDGNPDAAPIELIRRPDPSNPDTTLVFQQRFFSLASLRILLSDNDADILTLPTVTAFPPVSLGSGGPYSPGQYRAPFAMSPANPAIADGNLPATVYKSSASPLLNGFLKIDMQRQDGTWEDVTLEILNLGITGRNLADSNQALSSRWNKVPDGTSDTCPEPNPDAVIRLQRVRDIPVSYQPCGYTGTYPSSTVSTNATDYWPNALYDTREGQVRDGVDAPTSTISGIYLGGIMHYIELDMNNLRRWLMGDIGTRGTNARNENGFIVYFSDRRNNRNAYDLETGEYGYEDIVNPQTTTGLPANGILDAGEDVNGNASLEDYGKTPSLTNIPAGAAPPFNIDGRPTTLVPKGPTLPAPQLVARANRIVHFRRALKIVNGGINGGCTPTPCNNIVSPGLTIASENPVYVEGNFNATAASVTAEPNVAAAIIADAVTVLSNNWNDIRSFNYPTDSRTNTSSPYTIGRPAATTGYRMAVIAGKGLAFPKPSYADASFGSDGGAHNFFRSLEDWYRTNTVIRYRGSIVSFFINRQAVGTFKCCDWNAYYRGERDWAFDTDFLLPNLLPPGTPMFRDVNTLTFRQLLRPTQ